MSILHQPLTYDDLRRMPDDGRRYELIEGEIVVAPSPMPWHQVVSQRLNAAFDRAVVETGRGLLFAAPLDLRLPDGSVVQPDLLVFLSGNLPPLDRLPVDTVPNLVVEIVSPSSGERDRGVKRRLYARAGVPEYWIVDAAARAIGVSSDPHDGAYRATTVSTDVARSLLLPDLSVDLRRLFAAIVVDRSEAPLPAVPPNR